MEEAFEKLQAKSKAELFNQINRIKSSGNQVEVINHLMSFCLPFIIYDIKPYTNDNTNYSIHLQENLYIHYRKFESHELNILNFEKATSEIDIKSEEIIINPYSILNIALKKCRELNYIN